MPALFEFRRSTYKRELDTTGTDYESREVVTTVGSTGGNFFNWTKGSFNADSLALYPDEANVDGDTSDPSKFPLFPLDPNAASVEVYLRGYWGGTDFTTVTSVKFFAPQIDMSGYGQGAWVNARIVDQYPNGDPSLVGGKNPNNNPGPLFLRPDIVFPSFPDGVKSILQQSNDPIFGSLDLTPGLGISQDDEASRHSRYLVLQLVTGSDPTAGEGGQCTFKVTYDES